MGGVLVHIKAFKPHPIPHQSDVFKDVWGKTFSLAIILSSNRPTLYKRPPGFDVPI